MVVERRLRPEAQAQETHPVHVRLLLADQRPGELVPAQRADLAVELVVERRGTVRGRRAATAAAWSSSSASSVAISTGPNRSAATRTVSTSSAVRTKRACCTARSEIALTSVERCGRIVRNPSCDSRQKASRTGWRETPAAPCHLGLRKPRARRQRQRHHLLVERLEHLVRRGRAGARLADRCKRIGLGHEASVDSSCILAYYNYQRDRKEFEGTERDAWRFWIRIGCSRPIPTVRGLARALYAEVRDLPIISPHGHTDPRWYAEDAPFPDPAQLFVVPDHYVFRMLCSQGVPLADLGVPRADGGRTETDGRRIWRRFAENYHLLRGTPSRLWLDHTFETVFGLETRLSAATADATYDHIADCLPRPEFRPRALFRALQHRSRSPPPTARSTTCAGTG